MQGYKPADLTSCVTT